MGSQVDFISEEEFVDHILSGIFQMPYSYMIYANSFDQHLQSICYFPTLASVSGSPRCVRHVTAW